MIKVSKPLLFLDLESTGDDVCQDQIIEMGVSILHPDGSIRPDKWVRRFKPKIPIKPEATKAHGIRDEDLINERPFADYAEMIAKKVAGKDLAGYNLLQFDLPMLDEELRRSGFCLDMAGVRVIDAKSIFFKKCPRDLSAAVERFCGRKHEGAHGAASDCAATLDVLNGQLSEFEDLAGMSLDELAMFSRMNEYEPVDLAGKLYRSEDGFVCFNFGKNQGQRVVDQAGYCRWMSEHNFPGSTMESIEAELDRWDDLKKANRKNGK